ncbi:unnamed protein product [Lepeophtheirus salmonis]|uniref:(salmon louse) hypothetical protein n=1 Tax=Lepeophtheirus salmonis TaxID=72036 RepID=A0A7R8D2M9_LEPSM|nr:unnamed protein product [Lepeophtheirus salmonis]CAF3006628.1 unnamed protein product [Lepeophtheirus salmonis]
MPPQLMLRTKWFKTRENINKGDYVMEKSLKPGGIMPRGVWKEGIDTKTYPGEDGLVVKVRIRTSTGEYDHPISKLRLLSTGRELEEDSVLKKKLEDSTLCLIAIYLCEFVLLISVWVFSINLYQV